MGIRNQYNQEWIQMMTHCGKVIQHHHLKQKRPQLTELQLKVARCS